MPCCHVPTMINVFTEFCEPRFHGHGGSDIITVNLKLSTPAQTKQQYCLAFGEFSHKRDKCHSDSVMKFSEINMIKMLEFLNDTLFVVFDGCVFQHTVGIPTSINYASPRSFIHMKLTLCSASQEIPNKG